MLKRIYSTIMLLTLLIGDGAVQELPLRQFRGVRPPLVDYSWAAEEWTGDNRPYRAILESLHKAHEAGQPVAALLRKYRGRALKSPRDPKALFAWAYLTYWQGALIDQKLRDESLAVLDMMAKAPSPRTFEYSRARFLLEARQRPNMKLLPLAKRLVKRVPTDIRVKFFITDLLKWSKLPQERQQALAYAQDMLREYPREPRYHGMLGGAHWNIWWRENKPEHARKAIASWRRSIELLPSNHSETAWIEHLIRSTEKEMRKRGSRP